MPDGDEQDGTIKLNGFVEKPGPENAPSLYASVGSYLLTPDIWPLLEKEEPGVGGELVLGDSIGKLAQSTHVYGQIIEGVWHDAGDKSRYLQAIVDHALVDPKLGPAFRAYLEERLAQKDA